MNLVINASEAYGDGSGVIEVNTGVMHCDLSYLSETYLPTGLASGMYVYLEVTDTGCGMSEETRARAFDPFFSKKFTGRGLGLSAVLGIARGHGGTIKCESEPGKGTTFRVLLPSTSQHPTAQEQRGEVTTGWRGSGTVLVVDDEEAVRSLARDMLETLGFDVITASDGLEGVEQFRSDPEGIRLVLLDMTMPHFDGAETYREIRCIRKDAPAILTSGYDEHSVTCRFTGENKPGFLHKPYRFEDLKRAVRDALGDGCIGGGRR